ncbi:Protein neprosin [Cardamine amara subsp. amara]|uniref:Protein neprosin n=1 Tax=Cardamine amara subsp. amara TaxID=228776 RepID=A0ABD0ZBK0_CARAN
MKSSILMMLLFVLGYIVCFGDMASLNNSFVDEETFQYFSDFKNKKQLIVVNKPATNIIKTIHGDPYECVDFYKQPAFEHSSMKNHLFRYERLQIPSLTNPETNNKKFGYLWKNGIGCPTGTVPIKKVTKDEFVRLNSFSEKYKPQGSWNFTYNQSNIDNQHHFAVSRIKTGKGKIYNGATMVANIYNPKVKFPQYSSTRIHIQLGNDFIQAGYTVNPKLYSDSKTRNFVYTKVGENQCYNSMCSDGIIMVRSDFPLGSVEETCVRGDIEGYVQIYGLLKDKASGTWWLEIAGKQIGFWPANKFQKSSANNVEWGGEVYSAHMPSPQMGCGYFPVGRVRYDSVIYNITLVEENFEIDKRVKNIADFSDNTHGYRVANNIYSDIPVNNIIYYGGPGNI